MRSLSYDGASEGIIELFIRLAHEKKKCIIMVTHDLTIAEKSDVILRLDTAKKQFEVTDN